LFALLGLALAPLLRAEDPAPGPDEARSEITRLLREFLARVEEPAMHDRFWAADLVYTSSSGKVQTKADILQSFASLPQPDPAKPREPSPTYEAEDVLVRPYGATAALTFRLVAHNPDGQTATYRNSGTLLFRDGRWQVVTWQATKEPAAGAK
jgi:hypothetical protein